MEAKIKKLYLFNLATDLDDPLLAFTHDWIIAASKIVEKIEVISTHVGRYSLPDNVRVRELGGGRSRKRTQAIFKSLCLLSEIYVCRKEVKIFYHMSNRIASILCIPLKIIGVKQAIWYSHSSYPISLRTAVKFCDLIFSSAPSSLPFSNRKCRYVGHGINFSNFQAINEFQAQPRNRFVSLGRIAPIKNIEAFIDAIAQSLVVEKSLDLIGPSSPNIIYRQQLERYAMTKKVNIRFLGPVKYTEVPSSLKGYSICYTGNPRTTDKAAIEAASMGCFVVTTEVDSQKLTGMHEIWESLNLELPELVSQINKLIPLEANQELRQGISVRARSRNSVNNVLAEVMDGLKSV